MSHHLRKHVEDIEQVKKHSITVLLIKMHCRFWEQNTWSYYRYFGVDGCIWWSHKQDFWFNRAVLVLDASKVLPGCLVPNPFASTMERMDPTKQGKLNIVLQRLYLIGAPKVTRQRNVDTHTKILYSIQRHMHGYHPLKKWADKPLNPEASPIVLASCNSGPDGMRDASGLESRSDSLQRGLGNWGPLWDCGMKVGGH